LPIDPIRQSIPFADRSHSPIDPIRRSIYSPIDLFANPSIRQSVNRHSPIINPRIANLQSPIANDYCLIDPG
jgi:hypothetical protein